MRVLVQFFPRSCPILYRRSVIVIPLFKGGLTYSLTIITVGSSVLPVVLEVVLGVPGVLGGVLRLLAGRLRVVVVGTSVVLVGTPEVVLDPSGDIRLIVEVLGEVIDGINPGGTTGTSVILSLSFSRSSILATSSGLLSS